MARRKRMHGRKRRSPAKMFAPGGITPDGIRPDGSSVFGPMKPQGENATNYNPDRQVSRMQEMYMEAQKRMREQMQLQQPQGGGGGSHTHSVKVDGHSDSGGQSAQTPNYGQRIQAQMKRSMFGSGVQKIRSFDASPMAKKKKLKKKK